MKPKELKLLGKPITIKMPGQPLTGVIVGVLFRDENRVEYQVRIINPAGPTVALCLFQRCEFELMKITEKKGRLCLV